MDDNERIRKMQIVYKKHVIKYEREKRVIKETGIRIKILQNRLKMNIPSKRKTAIKNKILRLENVRLQAEIKKGREEQRIRTLETALQVRRSVL
jgi:hypothetical protein